ncbi:hypothetical protein IP88_08495 [alpha proteobacterium AAP81b]|nr:hypothetical protein IP88_08495 [alpha proteobacterium AAP81b]
MTFRHKPLGCQTLVLTGATSGIGLATALAAGHAGARLMLVARNAEALADAAARVRAAGGEAEILARDVGEPGWADDVAAETIARFGGFDSWINDAAAAVYGRVEELSLAEHERVFVVGYFGTVQGSLAAARHLRPKGGAIVNIGSVLSERTMVLQGAYSAMKHAVRGFTDALRMELLMDDAPVSVTLVKPTGMDTPYPEHARNKMDKPARIPPVVYDPRLVARAILFACEHSRREITVGGTGLAIAKSDGLAPAMTDWVMAKLMGSAAQSTDTPPGAGAADNLFEPRADGRIDSNQHIAVRRTSLWLEAQLRPAAATAVLAGAGLLAAGLLRRQGRSLRM